MRKTSNTPFSVFSTVTVDVRRHNMRRITWWDNITANRNFWSDDDELVLKAIREGFLWTQQNMWKELPTWKKTASGLPSTAGTTASVCFIKRGKLFIGHVGDSGIYPRRKRSKSSKQVISICCISVSSIYSQLWISVDGKQESWPVSTNRIAKIELARIKEAERQGRNQSRCSKSSMVQAVKWSSGPRQTIHANWRGSILSGCSSIGWLVELQCGGWCFRRISRSWLSRLRLERVERLGALF